MNERSLNPQFIFDWQKTRWDYRLAVLIGISLAGHILCFYIFQIVYPATTSLLPPAARISLLDPQNPQDQQILDWVEVNDPAAASIPSFRPKLVAQLTPRYRPSFSTVSPQLLPLTPDRSRIQGLPSLFSPENLLSIRSQPVREGQTLTFPTRVEVSPTLKPRLRTPSSPLPTTSKLVEPSTFFVGVSKDGKVDFAFLWTSSGDNDLDQTADRFVRKLKFDPAEAGAWGTVQLRWGSDERTEEETDSSSKD